MMIELNEDDKAIDISDEMIKAGLKALYAFDRRFGDGEDLVANIFEAMVRASQLNVK